MDIALYIIAPVLGTIALLALLFAISTPIYLFIEKTNIGQLIQNMTPWMGWTETIADPYDGFKIHSSNFHRTTTSR